MNIVPYIRELILLNECVILRGVGGFETAYKHADLDKKNNRFTPPSKQIIFRADWITDNKVLENHLMENLGLSRTNAGELIDDFVKQFYIDLRLKREVALEEIGVFFLDERKQIQFREFDGANYLADSFGLDVLEMDIEKKGKEKTKPEPLKLVPQPKRKLTAWYVAIGIVLLLVSVTFIILISKGSGEGIFNLPIRYTDDTADDIIIFGVQDSLEKDTLMKSIEKSLEIKTTPREALSIDLSSPQDEPDEIVSSTKYFLVAGSFKATRNAEMLKEQLIQKGFIPKILNMSGNFRVIVGEFDDRKAAIIELRRMRTQLDQSVWLLEEK